MKEKHGPRAHVCHICGLEFQYQRVLERHLLCHEDIKPFSCSTCGYKCKRKQDLRRHTRRMHSAGRPRRKRHEETIASIFVSMHIAFTREFVVKANTFAGRKSARIDFFLQMTWGFLFFEVDEWQHTGYRVSHEMLRMAAIRDHHFQRYPHLRIHIVRYNTHPWKQDGEIKKPTPAERLAKIQECLSYVPQARFEISYVFYRTVEGQLAISGHPEFTLQPYTRIVA